MYFLHAINSDRQTRLLNVLGQIAMILGDKKNSPAALPTRKRPGTHCIGGWMKFGNFKRLNVIIVSLIELSQAGAKPIIFYG